MLRGIVLSLVIFGATSLVAKPITRAPLPKAYSQTNPYPKGTAKKVAGIVTLAVGGGLGTLVLFLGAMGDCANDEKCDRDREQSRNFGLGLVAASAGIGIPLIIWGAEDRKRWQEFEDRRDERSALEPTHAKGSLTLIALPNGLGVGGTVKF